MSLDVLVGQIYPIRPCSGDIGLEIETEGSYSLDDSKSTYWKHVNEGSLRNGIEFVLKQPIPMDKLDRSLDEFLHMTRNCKLKPSLRTSVHVHVNAQRFTMRNVYNLLGCYWLIEPLLVHMNGKSREGNLFCLRAGDAEEIVFLAVRSLQSGNLLHAFTPDACRYSSINLASLGKFGSIEYRFIRGITDAPRIKRWTEELFQFSMAAKDKSLEDVLVSLQEKSSRQFLSQFFSGGFVTAVFEQLNEVSVRNFLVEGICYTYRLQKALENYRTPMIIKESQEDLDGPIEEPRKRRKEGQSSFGVVYDDWGPTFISTTAGTAGTVTNNNIDTWIQVDDGN